MPREEKNTPEGESIRQLRSDGHDPPRKVDERIPTQESTIRADGGPGRGPPPNGGEGSLPWLAGSIHIGSGNVYNVDYLHMEAGSPNIWVKLRHSRSGSTDAIPGPTGTIDSYHLAAQGGRTIIPDHNHPLRSVQGPGTLTAEVFGPRNDLAPGAGTVPHGSLGTNPGDAFAVTLRGHVI